MYFAYIHISDHESYLKVKICLLEFFSLKCALQNKLLNAHIKAWNIFAGFFGNLGSKVAWSGVGMNTRPLKFPA